MCVSFFTIVAHELERLGQDVEQLAVNLAGDGDGVKGAVGDADAVEGAGAALCDEVCSVGGLGLDDLGDVGDG